MPHIAILALTDLSLERIGWVLVIFGIQLAMAGLRMRRPAVAVVRPRFTVVPGRPRGPALDAGRDRASCD